MLKSKDDSMIFDLGTGETYMKDIKLNKGQPSSHRELSNCYLIGSDNKKWKTINS